LECRLFLEPLRPLASENEGNMTFKIARDMAIVAPSQQEQVR
jgi:hypothetical protein